MGAWDLMFNKNDWYVDMLIYCIGGLSTAWLLLGGLTMQWWLSWWLWATLCGTGIMSGFHFGAKSMAWMSMISTSAAKYSYYMCVGTIVMAVLYATFWGYALYAVADYCQQPQIKADDYRIRMVSAGVHNPKGAGEVTFFNYLQATVAFFQCCFHCGVAYFQYEYMSVLDTGKIDGDDYEGGYGSPSSSD